MYGDPPCFRCKIPTLLGQNLLAWQVFSVCSTQMLVVGMGTPLGIRFEAIQIALDIVGVHPDERTITFEKVRYMGEAYAKMVADRIEAERPASQKTTTRGVDLPPMYSPAEWKKRMDAFDAQEDAFFFDGYTEV